MTSVALPWGAPCDLNKRSSITSNLIYRKKKRTNGDWQNSGPSFSNPISPLIDEVRDLNIASRSGLMSVSVSMDLGFLPESMSSPSSFFVNLRYRSHLADSH